MLTLSDLKRSLWRACVAVVVAALGTTSCVGVPTWALNVSSTAESLLVHNEATWRYLDSNTDPAQGAKNSLVWTEPEFNDASWKSATGPFGVNGGTTDALGEAYPIDTLLNDHIAGTNKAIPTYHFRTTVDVDTAKLIGQGITNVRATVSFDDAVQVFVNGKKEFGFLDETVGTAPNPNLTYSGGDGDQPVTQSFGIPVDDLVDGENTIAVAVYQNQPGSDDAYFRFDQLVTEPAQVFMQQLAAVPADDAPTDIVLGIGATESERRLSWFTRSSDVNQAVQLVPSDQIVNGVFPSTAQSIAPTDNGATTSGEYYHHATLSNLEPETGYSYRVGSQENGWSPVYSFKTSAFSGDFSFAFLGDPQVGASGDLAHDEAGWKDTLKVATEEHPGIEMLFSSGDNVNSANDQNQFATVLSPPQLQEIPYVATIGNHDVGSKSYEQHFNVPNNDTTVGQSPAVWESSGDYWFKYKGVLFLNINSNSLDLQSHLKFMERIIAQEGKDVKWKVLAFHHSIYSVALHAGDLDVLGMRNTFPSKISELGINMVLMGHDHHYTRSFLIKDGALADAQEVKAQSKVEAKDGEVLYLTANSSSGSKYYDLLRPNAWYTSVRNQEKVRNYTLVDVTDDSVHFQTFRSEANGEDMPVNSLVDDVTLYRNEAPTITFADGDTTNVEYGSAFDSREGVTAVDNQAGDLTDNIAVEGSVDTTVTGPVTLTYTVTDNRGNTATRKRTVTVGEPDTRAPVFTLAGPSTVEQGQDFDPLAGVSARDDRDGDVTANITVGGQVDTSTPGTVTLTYRVTDAAGNVAEVSRQITVEKPPVTPSATPTTAPPTTQAPTTQAPTTAPPTTQAPETQAPTTAPPATQAPTTQAPTPSETATPSATDTPEADRVAPVFTFAGPLTVTVDQPFDPLAGVTAADARDGDLTAAITVSGEVDTSAPGTALLTYRVTDAVGNIAEVVRQIIIEPSPEPVPVDTASPTPSAPLLASAPPSMTSSASTTPGETPKLVPPEMAPTESPNSAPSMSAPSTPVPSMSAPSTPVPSTSAPTMPVASTPVINPPAATEVPTRAGKGQATATATSAMEEPTPQPKVDNGNEPQAGGDTQSRDLPRTGPGEVIPTIVLSLVLVGIGAVLVARSRKA